MRYDYNPKLEQPDRLWWRDYATFGTRQAVLNTLLRETAVTPDGYEYPVLKQYVSDGSFDDMDDETQRLCAYWLNIYGCLLSENTPYHWYVATNIQKHFNRQEWFVFVTLPVEKRLELDVAWKRFAPFRSPEKNGSITGLPALDVSLGLDQRKELASFWLSVLNENPRRFVDHKVTTVETHTQPVCHTRGCYAAGVNKIHRNTVDSHRLCERCTTSDCIRPVDRPDEFWYRTVCVAAHTYDGDNPIHYYSPESDEVSDLPRCRSCGARHDVPPEEFDECVSCGYTTTPSVIERSHTAPAPSTPQLMDDEPDTLNEFFGIELEVQFAKCKRPSNVLRSIADPERILFKYDGSIGKGCEIVTAPASYKWWIANSAAWTERLDVMRNAGFRSYDSGKCGMHIHIDRRAFSPSELLKLMELVYGGASSLFQRISQRTDFTYCSFGDSDAKHRSTRIAKAKNADPKAQKYESERRVAVNVPLTHPTVELRMFRGTLNVASFWKNIETAKALVMFVKTHSLAEMTEAKFLTFIADHAQMFRHLTAFLAKEQKPLKPTKPVRARKKPDKLVEVTANDFAEAAC